MRKTITVAILLFAGSFAILSCKKSKNDTKPYNMTANIGGTAFNQDSCGFTYNLLDTTDAQIYAWTASTYYPGIQIFFSAYHGAGTYAISNPGTVIAEIQNSASSADGASSGTVVITSVYPTVTGTFNFTTTTGTVVSGGSFRAMRP